jgi:CBS domain-containing protein
MISATITVGTTPTLLVAAATGTRTIYLHVIGNTIVYLGGTTVTTAAGTAVEKHTSPFPVTLRDGDSLYGIVASGTADMRVLRDN